MKLEFNSVVSSFKVTFPNKNYIKKVQLTVKKSLIVSGNIVSNEDYFVIKLYKNLHMIKFKNCLIN